MAPGIHHVGLGRRTIPSAFVAVAIRTTRLLVDLSSAAHRIRRARRLFRNRDRISRLLVRPSLRERLDVSDRVLPRSMSDRVPARHVSAVETVLESSFQIRLQRQSAGRRRAALEDRWAVVARSRIFVHRGFSVAVSPFAVTRHTVALVDDLALRRNALVPRPRNPKTEERQGG